MQNIDKISKSAQRNLDANLTQQLENGWIDNKGQFWGTAAGGHTYLLTSCFEMIGELAFEMGWILVIHDNHYSNVGNFDGFPEYWRPMGDTDEINQAQIDRLKAMGFDPNKPKTKRNDAIKFADVYPKGYETHILPDSAGEKPIDQPPAERDMEPQ